MVQMAAQSPSAANPETPDLAWTGQMSTVARQPIMNLNGRLHGYELLFRQPADEGHDEAAIGSLLDESVIVGFERLTNGFPGFVNCTAQSLTGQLVKFLPPRMTVLCIAESLDSQPAVVEACRNLKAQGFRLALDRFSGGTHPLLELADYVRVDLCGSAPASAELQALSRVDSVATIAKNVATQEDYRSAAAQRFTLFQGDYLFRPSFLQNRKLPANRLFHFEILRNLYRDSVDVRKLAQLVQRDASLTFRLLRLVNSPVCAIRQQVRSVETAIIIVGIDNFRRFTTMAVLGEVSADHPPEILRTALMRARFCDLGARHCRLDSSEQYLLGLLSLLPAMLRIPMNEITPTLPLRDEIRQALEGATNRERCLLDWLEHHEQGDWAGCDAIAEAQRLNQQKLVRFYGDALLWSETAIQSAANP
jgi:c-di-GMP phosphodiesterase